MYTACILFGIADEVPKLSIIFKGELNPKIKFVLFERTLKITE